MSAYLATLLMLGIAAPALAAPSVPWSAGNSVARAACIKAAGLSGAVASSLVVFSDDRSARTAILVNGRYRPSALRKAKRRCFAIMIAARGGRRCGKPGIGVRRGDERSGRRGVAPVANGVS